MMFWFLAQRLITDDSVLRRYTTYNYSIADNG
jgi:hypothetical protein